jgi:DNA polymerase III alpha subunit (gram-positive type)
VTTYAFLDLETTGLDPDRHELWEIGIVYRDDTSGDPDTEYCWQIARDLATAEPGALRVSRYYERNIASLLTPGRAACLTHLEKDKCGCEWDAADVASAVAHLTDGTTIVAANVTFDAAFLDRFLRANRYAPAWDYHLVEVESYAAGALGLTPPWKLNGLMAALGVPQDPDGAHTALGDARSVRDLFDAARALRAA